LKREAARVQAWRDLDENYAVGEFSLQLYSWDRARRFVVIRERLREEHASAGRKLLDVPGYTFRIYVTNAAAPPEEIWRDYNQRADVEETTKKPGQRLQVVDCMTTRTNPVAKSGVRNRAFRSTEAWSW
jgi:hypothetical protein